MVQAARSWVQNIAEQAGGSNRAHASRVDLLIVGDRNTVVFGHFPAVGEVSTALSAVFFLKFPVSRVQVAIVGQSAAGSMNAIRVARLHPVITFM
jgi:hypothetical protein